VKRAGGKILCWCAGEQEIVRSEKTIWIRNKIRNGFMG
jgi:hypothetical protein